MAEQRPSAQRFDGGLNDRQGAKTQRQNKKEFLIAPEDGLADNKLNLKRRSKCLAGCSRDFHPPEWQLSLAALIRPWLPSGCGRRLVSR